MRETGQFFRKNASRFLLAALIVLPVLFAFLLSLTKQSCHIDELYSLDTAHSYIQHDRYYLNNNEAWQTGSWMNNGQLKRLLSVGKEDSLLSLPFGKAAKKLLTGRNYFGMLNLVNSVFSPGKMSIFPGIGLNLIILLLIQIVLYLLFRKMKLSPEMTGLGLLMNGFCGMTLSMTVFVRFYLWVDLLVLLVLYLYLQIREEQHPIKWLAAMLAADVLLYLALKDSELVFIFWITLGLLFAVELLLERRIVKLLCHLGISVGAGGFYLLRNTWYFDVLMNPSRYLDTGGMEDEIARSFLNMSPSAFLHNLISAGGRLNWFLFGCIPLTAVFAGLIVFLFLYRRKQKKQGRLEKADPMPDRFLFGWTLFGVTVLYILGIAQTGLYAMRYMSIPAVLCVILLWSLLDRLLAGTAIRKKMTVLLCAVTVFTLIYTAAAGHISNLRPTNRELYRTLKEYRDRDSVVVSEGQNFPVYECVAFCAEESRVYAVSKEARNIPAEECPEELLVWSCHYVDPEEYLGDLTSQGYVLRELGQTEYSLIWLCCKNR